MRNIKRSAIVGGAALALIGGGIAFAAWTSTGTGTGSAVADHNKDLVVSVNTNVTGLFPTGHVDVPFTVQNKNPYKMLLSGAVASNLTVDSGHSTCGVTSVSIPAVTLTDSLAPSETSGPHMVRVNMDNSAVQACEGATFTFDLTATGASSN